MTCNSLEAWEKSHVRGAIGFGFDSDWSKKGRESFKPITKRSNHNHVITFNSHLKTALTATSVIKTIFIIELAGKASFLLFTAA